MAEDFEEPWVRGVYYEMCQDHRDGEHPGYDDPKDPCVARQVLFNEDESACYISTSNHGLVVGWTEDGPMLDEPFARRIVAAVNACKGIPTEALENGDVSKAIKILASIIGNEWVCGSDEDDGKDVLFRLIPDSIAR